MRHIDPIISPRTGRDERNERNERTTSARGRAVERCKTRVAPERDRLCIEVHLDDSARDVLERDVRSGLGGASKTLPPKYFYDELGSLLFDAICDTPEYYQTRTELALLHSVADRIVQRGMPADLVELGSGAARKTRALLDALARSGRAVRYVPFDVSESMLRSSAERLLLDYPELRVHGVVADYERHLSHIPAGGPRLFAFLGSTIGNFEALPAVRFIRNISQQMRQDDRFLLGVDLVKDVAVLNAAYNDAQGITARFNKNVLSVINRELAANFELSRFEHVAFFNPEQSQIELYLEARAAHAVHVRALDMRVDFAAGERIRTEISRKFTRNSVASMLESAGQTLEDWYTSSDGYFALAVARRGAS